MGKRKTTKKAAPANKLTPLGTTFKCLFCHHDKSVSVKLDRSTMFGQLNCKICGQKFTAPINNLSAAVDIYCDWVDACEEIQAKQPKKQRAPRGPSPLKHGAQGGANLNITSRNAPIDDEDAEGEEDDEGNYYDAVPSRHDFAKTDAAKKQSSRRDYDDEDSERDSEDDLDDQVREAAAREKRRRVEVAQLDVDSEDDE